MSNEMRTLYEDTWHPLIFVAFLFIFSTLKGRKLNVIITHSENRR